VGLNVGIAGFGLAGRVFHAPLIAAVDGLNVSAVMTRSPEREAQAHAEYPDARIVGELDALLDGIDVLVVATPNSAHVGTARAGLDRGLAVVVDKPIAATASDAGQLVGSGGRLTVFQNRRWDGDFLTAARLIRDGALGEVLRFESRFEQFSSEVDPDRWRENPDPAEGGGVLLDLGAHLVDQAVFLFGPPVRVYGELHRRRPGAEVEDDAFIALEHANGVTSHLSMSKVAPLYGPRLRVGGLAAGFACDGLDPQEAQLAGGIRPGDPDFGVAPPGRLDGDAIDLEVGRYEDFYVGVRDWARGSAPAPVDPADSVRVLRILEAARRSTEQAS
jgi:predicted dehydrogenase